MRRIRYKKIFKDGIIGYVQRIALTVFTTLLVAFVLSLFLEFSFKAKSKTFDLTDCNIEVFIFSASCHAYSIIDFDSITASFISLSFSF